MSSLIMFEVYDFTNDKSIGVYQNDNIAESVCDEYISNYGEPVEVIVQTVDLEPCC